MLFLKKVNLLKRLINFLSPIHKYSISGNSMYPTVKNGSSVFVNRLSYLFKKPGVDEVVACIDPRDGRVIIKRIKKIENGKYFVTGDNKDTSTDSRKFGMIKKEKIIGRVFY